MLDLLDAAQQRAALGARMNLFHQTYDLLLTPTLPLEAFDAGLDVADVLKEQAMGRMDALQLSIQPDAAAGGIGPCGLTKHGLPVGLQIVGPRYADARVLRAARAFESLQPFPMPERGLATLGA